MKTTKIIASMMIPLTILSCDDGSRDPVSEFNTVYRGDRLSRIAFPLGGLGAGMVCLEGNGSVSGVSVRHKPDVFNEPFMFGAIAVRGVPDGAKVLEGPVQKWKIFGGPASGNGSSDRNYGFPRFEKAEFQARFPFAEVKLSDADIPLEVGITGWSPFIPTDEDNSSLPVAALEYRFRNLSDSTLELVFSYHSQNFMRVEDRGNSIQEIGNGYVLAQTCFPDKPHYKGDFAITTLEDAVVDHRWFRGGWYDGRTLLWKDIQGMTLPADTAKAGSTGASLYVPLKLEPGGTGTVHLLMSWYVPHSDQRYGSIPPVEGIPACDPATGCCSPEYTAQFYEPWYAARFPDVFQVSEYWRSHYQTLRDRSEQFTRTFFASDLPPEVLEAVSANLSILKSPTVLRQKDGNLWNWEGCLDQGSGCCMGSCTHVWNYAQAIPHLFPRLERTLRETEFLQSQDEGGHQNFRSALPIQYTDHSFHAAADGQLGGIMKVYREWRISADTAWLRSIWPAVMESYNYCSSTWDPRGRGMLEEPHHNTYDIEFWGPDGMCTSIYLGATQAMTRMAQALGEDPEPYARLLDSGTRAMENELYNGEYFIQKTTWEGLNAPPPNRFLEGAWNVNYSEEAMALLQKEGPKYQYGTGCLSDGIIGEWFNAVCGMPGFLEPGKVKSHLNAVYRYNFKTDLTDHVNPQRPGFAMGEDGGLLLCSWPDGDQPTLPFVYSNEVWTGIEYQVASHLMMHGEVDQGLDIVRAARRRYDGTFRNPFNEYECGHWYARALSSYALMQGLTGLFYDAPEKTLYIHSQLGDDFQCFISTETGFGLAGLKKGEPFLQTVYGTIVVERFADLTER